MTSQTLSERFSIHGHGLHQGFVDWIAAHGRKLGLTCDRIELRGDQLHFDASGLPDMLDAMEMGCSLGPITATVAHIERRALSC